MQGGNSTIRVSTFRTLRKTFEHPIKIRAGHFTHCYRFFILQISQDTEYSGQLTVGFIGAGDYIGEVSLLTGASYAATATARTHCRLYGLDCNVIKRLLAANSDLYAEFDRSARRGLAILNRGVAVRATDDKGRQSLLHRIRAFFDNPR